MPEIENIQVRPYRDTDWKRVREFIKMNWREDHPICSRPLFDWQFKGFGNENRKISSLVLLHNDEVIGFRGFIPGLYQVPCERDKMEIIQGGSSAMWTVAKDFRGKRLGFLLQSEADKRIFVMTGAHSDPKTSLPIYLKSGFSVLDSMNRYVVPLDPKGYHHLLSRKVDVGKINEWAKIWRGGKQPEEPTEPDIDALASVWEETTFPLKIFSLYRNAEFWKWRYLDSAGFTYLFFGDIRDVGLIVARTETISSKQDKDSELNGRKVFRIIEIVPRDHRAWKGELDARLVKLIQRTIHWAIQQGCLAVDFYCSTSRFDPTLEAAGFGKHYICSGPPIRSLAILFQPLKRIEEPINVFFRIDVPSRGLVKLSFEDTYMVKSEADMDRPNLYNFREYQI